MTKHRLIRTLLVASLLVPFSGLQAATAMLDRLVGQPTIFEVGPAGARHASLPQRGAEYRLPIEIETGPGDAATFRLSDGEVAVAPNSMMRVAAPEAASGGLLQRVIQSAGAALFSVDRREVEHFQVETPYLVSVVKGTTFNVVVHDTGATVALQEGRLLVTSPDGARQVELLPGDVAYSAAAGDLEKLSGGVPHQAPVDAGRTAAAQTVDPAADSVLAADAAAYGDVASADAAAMDAALLDPAFVNDVADAAGGLGADAITTDALPLNEALDDALGADIGGDLGSGGDLVADLGAGGADLVGDLGGTAGDLVGDIGDDAGDLLGSVNDDLGDLTGDLTDSVGDLTGDVAGTVGDLTGDLAGTAGDLTGDLLGSTGDLTGGLGEDVGGAADGLLDGIADGDLDLGDTTGDLVGGLVGGTSDAVGGLLGDDEFDDDDFADDDFGDDDFGDDLGDDLIGGVGDLGDDLLDAGDDLDDDLGDTVEGTVGGLRGSLGGLLGGLNR